MRTSISSVHKLNTSAELATHILDYKAKHPASQGLLAIKDGELRVVSKRSFLFNFRAIRQAASFLNKANIVPTKNIFAAHLSEAFIGAKKYLGSSKQISLLSHATQTIRQLGNGKLSYVVCKNREEVMHQDVKHIRVWPSSTHNDAIALLLPRLKNPILIKSNDQLANEVNDHIRNNYLLQNGWTILQEKTAHLKQKQWDTPALSTFRDIRSNPETRVHKNLNANLIKLSAQQSTIAASYPSTKALPTYLGMLLEKQPSAIFVLVEGKEIKGDLPAYFQHSFTHNAIQTQTMRIAETPAINALQLEQYKLNIIANSQSAHIPLFHITNWSDFSEGQGTLALMELALHVERFGGTPLIHCRGGVGRTGTLIAARMMTEESKKGKIYTYDDVIDLVTRIREQRNELMIQTPKQLEILFELADLLRNESKKLK